MTAEQRADRLRIAVVSELPQFHVGGIESQSFRQIRVWLRLGHEVRVFGKSLPDRGSLVIDGIPIGLRRINVWNRAGRAGRACSYIISLATLIRQNETWADVVYCMGLGEAAFTVAALKAMYLSTLPIVAMPGSAGPLGDVGYIRSIPGYPMVVKLLNRHCDSIVSIAPQLPSDLHALGLHVPLTDIPVGIPIAPQRERVETSQPLRLIAVGRLVEQKGFDILLRALGRLPEHLLGVVRIIGEGPERQHLKSLASELGVAHRVCWLGALAPDQVQANLAAADVFVQPSRYEGLSNAALEAMCSGLPLLVTRCGGIDRYIDAASGWTVPIEDPSALAGVLEQVLQTPPNTLLRMGQRCRMLVEAHFDIEQTSRAYLALFASLKRTTLRRGNAQTA